jgi:hypothetical protein
MMHDPDRTTEASKMARRMKRRLSELDLGPNGCEVRFGTLSLCRNPGS